VTDEDAVSIGLFGRLAQIITTTIKHQADAESQAAFYLTLRSYPQANFNQITFELTNSEIDDADRDALINIFMGLPLRITDLPLNMAPALIWDLLKDGLGVPLTILCQLPPYFHHWHFHCKPCNGKMSQLQNNGTQLAEALIGQMP
jgi:hypothetical protein